MGAPPSPRFARHRRASPAETRSAKAGWLDDGYRHIWMPYAQMQTAPMPEAVTATRGTRIGLADGRELIDGISSWWSACHGYNHPHIRDAVRRQLDRMPHVMLGGLANEPAFTLAARLANLAPGSLNRVFYSESGSVAVEVAMKMAVQYWRNLGQAKRRKFVCFDGAYHGDTIGAMAVGDPAGAVHGAVADLMGGQHRARLPRDGRTLADFRALLAAKAPECAGVILEPLVQGAGGMLFHTAETLKAVADAARDHGLLLILDEIMTGFGRLGTMFACEQAGVAPDIMTLSKSLTGGTLPLAATIATAQVFGAFLSDDPDRALMHGPTFAGNALACAAANASLDLFEREPRLAQVRAIEKRLSAGLEPCRGMAGVVDVRVKGALGVVELQRIDDLDGMRRRFVDAGCWIRPFGNVVYLMPAFTIDDGDLATLTRTVVEVVGEWSAARRPRAREA